MRKIAVANRKGGVGKTTSAVHLAAGLALAGRKVLLIDTDAQGHAGRLLGVDPGKGLADVMEGQLRLDQAITTARSGLDLLAGGKALAGVDRLIARESIRPEERLSKMLAGLEGKYEYVIVDTSPSFSELSTNVLFYCSEAVVPVSMEILAAEGLVSFAEEVKHVQEYHELAVRWISRRSLTAGHARARTFSNPCAGSTATWSRFPCTTARPYRNRAHTGKPCSNTGRGTERLTTWQGCALTSRESTWSSARGCADGSSRGWSGKACVEPSGG